MRSACLAESADKLLVRAVEKKNVNEVTFCACSSSSTRVESSRKLPVRTSIPRLCETQTPGPKRRLTRNQLGCKRWWKVIDTKKSEILQHVQRRTSPRAGHPRHHHQVQRTHRLCFSPNAAAGQGPGVRTPAGRLASTIRQKRAALGYGRNLVWRADPPHAAPRPNPKPGRNLSVIACGLPYPADSALHIHNMPARQCERKVDLLADGA